jgi:hypothetical protein
MIGTAIVVGLLFVAAITAFVLLLARRDRTRAAAQRVAPHVPPPQGPEGSLYALVAGERYVVLRAFTDYYGNAFAAGGQLTFRERHFLPYHGGHTIVFEERPLYLQEEVNRDIVDGFAEYIARPPR